MFRRVSIALALTGLAIGVPALAQTPPASSSQSSQPPPATTQASEETRPATTTFFGDTGLWFVPTAEVLPDRKWSASGYRASLNTVEGFSNIAHFAATFGVGLRDRVELFGSWRADTRVDRDIRPLFTSDTRTGGLVHGYPFVRDGWIGNKVGDLLVGAKVNLLSEYRQNPVAFAVRGTVKLPTGDKDSGASTGKADIYADAIVSKELNELVELSGFGGYVWRGDPSSPVALNLSNGFRWGVGAGFPTRSPLRLTTELHGELPFDDTLAVPAFTANDQSVAPPTSRIEKTTTATVGVTFQAKNGFFVGGGLNWNWPTEDRSNFRTDEDATGDFADFQVRIGYHPGARVYVAPPPPPPPPPAPPANRAPTVKARCEPCTVEIGKSSTVTADAQDPDGDPLIYKWTAPAGTFASPAQQQTIWTAPDQEGAVPATVSVDDGKGGTASDTVTIQVVRPAVKTFVFEDVHFDFDRYNLRPEATRILDEAVRTLRENPGLRVEIEGHTCNIGTAEYNLALGERRANSARDYLVSQGINADWLRTVSYGEERPKYDNSREETRRLNRRAAIIVRIQQ